MSYMVLWIDSKHAKLFSFTKQGVEKSEMEMTKHEQHVAEADKNHGECREFYDRVAKALQNPEELLVVGPGNAKKHFKTELDSHHKNLAQKVVAVENMDHPTDGQIVDHAKRFFRKHDIFNAL